MRIVALWLLLASTAYAQLELTADRVSAIKIESSTPPQLFGSVVVAEDFTKVDISEAFMVRVKTRMKFVDVVARKSLQEVGTLTPVSETSDERVLLLSGPEGDYLIEAIGFDPDIGIKRASTVVKIGNKPPAPTPSNLPEDFDGIAAKIAKLSSNLDGRKAIASVYKRYSSLILSEPSLTVGSVSPLLAQEISAITAQLPQVSKSEWQKVATFINSETQARWPMAKDTLSQFWMCIALGLEY